MAHSKIFLVLFFAQQISTDAFQIPMRQSRSPTFGACVNRLPNSCPLGAAMNLKQPDNKNVAASSAHTDGLSRRNVLAFISTIPAVIFAESASAFQPSVKSEEGLCSDAIRSPTKPMFGMIASANVLGHSDFFLPRQLSHQQANRPTSLSHWNCAYIGNQRQPGSWPVPRLFHNAGAMTLRRRFGKPFAPSVRMPSWSSWTNRACLLTQRRAWRRGNPRPSGRSSSARRSAPMPASWTVSAALRSSAEICFTRSQRAVPTTSSRYITQTKRRDPSTRSPHYIKRRLLPRTCYRGHAYPHSAMPSSSPIPRRTS
jgi:hypothetical protein